MYPIWFYFVVAAVIALIAFAIGQIVPGLGVAFVALASTMWVAIEALCRRVWLRRSSRTSTS